MKKTNRIFLPAILIVSIGFYGFIILGKNQLFRQMKSSDKPTLSFSFDDGKVDAQGGYALENWNEMILQALTKHAVKSVLFSSGANKNGEPGKYVLKSWNDAGHRIANHTFSHKNFNSDKISLEFFRNDFLRNDSIISAYSNYYRYFRFPFLKEGKATEKINGFREFLKSRNYKNGHVSIDASDWYIDDRLLKRLKENPKADISGFKVFYIDHLYNRAMYYESLSFRLTGRHISHVILLHHNLAAALFLDDLINHFKNKGWNITDAEKAYGDPVYATETNTIPAGESLIWSMAKESRKFEGELRYPAEDGEYEKVKMDSLGL